MIGRIIGKQHASLLIKKHFMFISFILPVIILEAAYASRGVFPFGPKDLLVVDLYHQYAPFLSELQNRLRAGSSLFYSWSGGMGADFYSIYAYYLASPMNVLVMLFPKSCLTEAVLALTLIKVGLSGAFFSVYLKEAYGKRDPSVVAFSVMYSLSGYVIAYSWNIMWMEGIYLMPLVVLGMIRLIRRDRAMLYIVSTGLLLFSNFYIAFFAVLFTIIYYPILIVQFLPRRGMRSIARKTLEAAGFSILAAGFAAVMILPTLAALRLTSAAGSSFPKSIEQYYDLFDYIGRHFPIAAPVIREGLPNIYCGLAAFMLVPLFFLSRRFLKLDKILNGALLFFLIMSFNLNVLNFIWHGFHFPNQLPFRNSFVYIFFLVTLAFRSFDALREFSGRVLLGITGFTAVLVLITAKLNDKTPDFPDVYLVLLLTGLFAVVFSLKGENAADISPFVLSFLLVVALEITISTVLTVEKVDENEYYSTRSGYLTGKEIPELFGQIQKIKKDETGFYRMEVVPRLTSDDPYLYNYNGISIFSSMMPEKTVTTMENLGFHSNSINSYAYKGSTPALDSLFGVKYLISKVKGAEEPLKTPIYSKGDLTVYKNPYAASIGYLAPEAMKHWNSRISTPLSLQNNLIEGLTGVKDVFKPVKSEAANSTNADVAQSYPNHYTFTRNDAGVESRVSIRLKDVANSDVYFYLDTEPNKIDSGYVMAGTRKIDFDAKRSTIVDVGFCRDGEAVSVELACKADSDIKGSFSIYADVMDEAKFKEAMGVVKSNSLNVEQFGDTSVGGTIDAASSGVLFTTIPYHRGWSVKVDGARVETYAIDGGFLAFDISGGRHTIRMNYMTPLFPLGACITLVSLIAVLVGIILRWKYFL